MILYHFTSKVHLPLIMIGGLDKGEVPITPTDYGTNAVWLTPIRFSDSKSAPVFHSVEPVQDLVRKLANGEVVIESLTEGAHSEVAEERAKEKAVRVKLASLEAFKARRPRHD